MISMNKYILRSYRDVIVVIILQQGEPVKHRVLKQQKTADWIPCTSIRLSVTCYNANEERNMTWVRHTIFYILHQFRQCSNQKTKIAIRRTSKAQSIVMY